MKILFVAAIGLLVASVAGFIWRLFFAPSISKDERNPRSNNISNLQVYKLLSNDIKWIIAFQTGILASLLIMILSKL